ncbi:DUF1326 domain-containing protein [Stappia sp. F7233]|uniref:DUF1326 domain-containing protein n=1 Tax=Stappia albiluteola TaxID=2758565 RepID=A0A839ABX0_9HYPH|nr:DUF1326 domain-containing protein [Stappia albiluteola]MBA5776625.1 DUF1326 domain-containing protein [Stappia albiluteola]
MTPWEIRTTEFANCNCAYGCPCQFNALPTHGHCQAVVCQEITEGHYGDVDLKGVRFGGVFAWPGPIHMGHGRCQPFVDEAASPQQREAVLKIMSGEDTDPMATVFSVFASTMETVYDPVFAPIAFEVDVEGRRGRYKVANVVDSTGQPIRNPVTGAEHRVRIDLPHGFEYEIAEVGSGSSTAKGPVAFTLENSYAQFAHLHLNNHGVVRHRSV